MKGKGKAPLSRKVIDIHFVETLLAGLGGSLLTWRMKVVEGQWETLILYTRWPDVLVYYRAVLFFFIISLSYCTLVTMKGPLKVFLFKQYHANILKNSFLFFCVRQKPNFLNSVFKINQNKLQFQRIITYYFSYFSNPIYMIRNIWEII